MKIHEAKMTVLVNFQVFAVVKLAGEQGVYRKTDLGRIVIKNEISLT